MSQAWVYCSSEWQSLSVSSKLELTWSFQATLGKILLCYTKPLRINCLKILHICFHSCWHNCNSMDTRSIASIYRGSLLQFSNVIQGYHTRQEATPGTENRLRGHQTQTAIPALPSVTCVPYLDFPGTELISCKSAMWELKEKPGMHLRHSGHQWSATQKNSSRDPIYLGEQSKWSTSSIMQKLSCCRDHKNQVYNQATDKTHPHSPGN